MATSGSSFRFSQPLGRRKLGCVAHASQKPNKSSRGGSYKAQQVTKWFPLFGTSCLFGKNCREIEDLSSIQSLRSFVSSSSGISVDLGRGLFRTGLSGGIAIVGEMFHRSLTPRIACQKSPCREQCSTRRFSSSLYRSSTALDFSTIRSSMPRARLYDSSSTSSRGSHSSFLSSSTVAASSRRARWQNSQRSLLLFL